ncbi:MAG: hypothetical protein KY394_05395 [Actinobacteria bacterium]|nr:hypothetical protein [Actinomycetota bacterium]
MSTGWLIGYIIGGVVVILVVALLLILIFTARKIGDQADDIEAALATARDRTLALWEVEQVNARVGSIRDRLAAARQVLGG